jgi:LmbE family N-acetylglucosaminyl deacetylase
MFLNMADNYLTSGTGDSCAQELSKSGRIRPEVPVLSDRSWNAPSDHRDLHGVVDDKARDHGIAENRERLPPRQWQESRETDKRSF